MSDDYKDLNLDRATLDEKVQGFIRSNGYVLDEIMQQDRKKRVIFGAAGADFATVDLHLNTSGSTTVQWKLGKNQSLGEKLAIYLKGTIDPAEFEQVNYSLIGISSSSFDPILDCLVESNEFQIDVRRDDLDCKLVKLKSIAHQDSITLTHHRNTRRLQIQGRPLSCYRRVVFMLTDLLDLKGLEQVLYRKDDSSAEIVRKEVAESYLAVLLPNSYAYLPLSIKKLLLSGCCIQLAAPVLSDYGLLLYPVLRSLEGVLRQAMIENGMSVEYSEKGFGDFFVKERGSYELRSNYIANVGNANLVGPLNRGYSFFRTHRHTLFHMEDLPDGSRMVDTLEKAVSLSNHVYKLIDELYAARK